MELRKIDLQNVWEIANLKTNENQLNFVATNAESLIEAYAAIQSGEVALPFGLYEDGVPVGFAMIGYGSVGDSEEAAEVDNSYCLWRFMIDKKYQGRGLGKAGITEILRYIRTFPCGEAKICRLSYEPENIAAKSLYAKFGFKENGEKVDNEVVAVLKL